MTCRSLGELKNFRGKKVVLRLDLNVPIRGGVVFDDFRVKGSMPTLNYLRDGGAKVIIISHIGEKGLETLRPVADYLNVKLLPLRIDSSLKNEIGEMSPGQVVMLENLRQDLREIQNGIDFARELASLGDIYVNDAFSVSHRKHASIVTLPSLLPSYVGFLLQSEMVNLSKAFDPPHPFLLILGGIKFETKINLVKKFVGIADQIFIGGGLSNTLFKKMGYEVGVSLVDQKDIDLDFIFSAMDKNKIILPVDVTVSSEAGNTIKRPDQVLVSENILDMGTESLESLRRMIDKSKFILWNGPMGNFEKGFKNVTEKLALAISQSGARSIVGGGDTLASIRDLGIMDKFTFVSSGGGAMLDFLVNGTLPGIETIKNYRRKTIEVGLR